MQELKNLRAEIGVALSTTRQLPYSREISLTVTKLQTALLWLGKCLVESGQADPKDSFPEIPGSLKKTTDTSALSAELKRIIDSADSFQENYSAQDLTLKFRMFYQTAVLCLIEASMWVSASNQTDCLQAARESLAEQQPNN